MQLAKEHFLLLRDLIYEKSGLFFDEKKMYFVKNRLESRLTSMGFSEPLDYYRYLKYGKDSREITRFVEALTTNETYFFRESPQLQSFSEEAIPLIVEQRKKTGVPWINIWSAGCSTGEEPYTLAILIKENPALAPDWRVSIHGTDINAQVLKSASRGHYSERSVKDVPNQYLQKYFTRTSDGYQLNEEIKKMVTLNNVNLMDKLKMRQLRNMDFIFCRNVLIYFDDDSRKQVLNHFYDNLNKGGFIFLGHSESVGRISAAFQLTRLKNSLAYRK